MQDDKFVEIRALFGAAQEARLTQLKSIINKKVSTEERIEVMGKYDKEIYWPEMWRVKKLCIAEGHKKGPPYTLSTEWSITSCECCGQSLTKTGPDGVEEAFGGNTNE